MTACKCTLFFIVFTYILHHFYLIDDIYDTKPTFSYQYFNIYSVRYEYLICARIPNIFTDIRYPIWKTLIRYDPDIRYLEPWFANKKRTQSMPIPNQSSCLSSCLSLTQISLRTGRVRNRRAVEEAKRDIARQAEHGLEDRNGAR